MSGVQAHVFNVSTVFINTYLAFTPITAKVAAQNASQTYRSATLDYLVYYDCRTAQKNNKTQKVKM